MSSPVVFIVFAVVCAAVVAVSLHWLFRHSEPAAPVILPEPKKEPCLSCLDWEHRYRAMHGRYKSLQGKYDKEMPRLLARIAELEGHPSWSRLFPGRPK